MAIIAAVGITALSVGKASYDSGYSDGVREAKPSVTEPSGHIARRNTPVEQLQPGDVADSLLCYDGRPIRDMLTVVSKTGPSGFAPHVWDGMVLPAVGANYEASRAILSEPGVRYLNASDNQTRDADAK
jgi:hypothetical protein